jgi:hypothetical protein
MSGSRAIRWNPQTKVKTISELQLRFHMTVIRCKTIVLCRFFKVLINVSAVIKKICVPKLSFRIPLVSGPTIVSDGFFEILRPFEDFRITEGGIWVALLGKSAVAIGLGINEGNSVGFCGILGVAVAKARKREENHADDRTIMCGSNLRRWR